MSESAPPDAANSRTTRTAALIAELENRHEAWRREVQELTRLHAEAHDIAQREADDILARTRSEVCRIIVDARKQLREVCVDMRTVQQLKTEIEGMSKAASLGDGGVTHTSAHDDDHATPDSVLKARSELRRMLDDATPDLTALSSEVLELTKALRGLPAPDAHAAARPMGRRDAHVPGRT
jgi:hypothetical protein